MVTINIGECTDDTKICHHDSVPTWIASNIPAQFWVMVEEIHWEMEVHTLGMKKKSFLQCFIDDSLNVKDTKKKKNWRKNGIQEEA